MRWKNRNNDIEQPNSPAKRKKRAGDFFHSLVRKQMFDMRE